MAERLSVWQATKSILASFVGIQSKKNLERDANSGNNFSLFIILGFTIAIVLHGFLFLIAKIISWQTGVE